MGQRRIWPQQVLAAYEATGLKPVRGEWFSDGCSCPLGALYLQARNLTAPCGEVACDDALKQADDWSCEVFGIVYTEGFFKGFDTIDKSPETHFCHEERLGFDDGRAAARTRFPDEAAP